MFGKNKQKNAKLIDVLFVLIIDQLSLLVKQTWLFWITICLLKIFNLEFDWKYLLKILSAYLFRNFYFYFFGIVGWSLEVLPFDGFGAACCWDVFQNVPIDCYGNNEASRPAAPPQTITGERKIINDAFDDWCWKERQAERQTDRKREYLRGERWVCTCVDCQVIGYDVPSPVEVATIQRKE